MICFVLKYLLKKAADPGAQFLKVLLVNWFNLAAKRTV